MKIPFGLAQYTHVNAPQLFVYLFRIKKFGGHPLFFGMSVKKKE